MSTPITTSTSPGRAARIAKAVYRSQAVDRHALILKAVALAGSQAKLARAVEVTRSAVYYWVRHGTQPGPKTARLIEQKFGIPKEDLLPEVFGDPKNGAHREI